VVKHDGQQPAQKFGPYGKNFIRAWREFRGIAAQGDLAEKAGLARETVNRLESGKLAYKQRYLVLLAKALDCSPMALIEVNPYEQATIFQIYAKLPEVKKRKALRALQALASRNSPSLD